MSEYDSPLRGMRSYKDNTSAEDQQDSSNGDNSFISTPPSRGYRGNWNNRTPYRGRGFYSRNQNAFRHSTPYNYNKNRNTNSPYNRGTRHANSNRGRNYEFKATDYFHPSMLGNPWAELEKRYEPSEKKIVTNKIKADSSSDDSNEESES